MLDTNRAGHSLESRRFIAPPTAHAPIHIYYRMSYKKIVWVRIDADKCFKLCFKQGRRKFQQRI